LPTWSETYISEKELTQMQAKLIFEIEQRGAPRYEQEKHTSFMAGLFQGHAGCAYILMRIMAPSVVPSILGWQV
jgi:lantibiotic modifying enzyme